jgi:multicomponent Na+:H+ antiporter subunit E
VRKRLGSLGRLGTRFTVFLLIWWVLTEGFPGAWWFGSLVVIPVALATWRLRNPFPWRWRPWGLVRFFPFFVRQSLIGGIDVARRAMDPRLPLDPMMLDYPLRLPEGPAQVFLAGTVSLLPGTCSVALEKSSLRIHVLDGSLPVRQVLDRVEERVARLFGLEIGTRQAGEG